MGTNIGSDYILVNCKVNLILVQKKKQCLNIEGLRNESKECMQINLKTGLDNNRILDEDNIEQLQIKIRTNIQKATEEACGKGKIETTSTDTFMTSHQK